MAIVEHSMTAVEAMEVEVGVGAALHREEVSQQISTAKRFPRSISRFINDVTAMATLSESVAEGCCYAIPREGRTIEGPSARMAEIVAHAWGNCRAGARIIDDSGDFVIAQGIFIDLERNTAISYEVRRRIVDRRGNRFSPDMIAVTANAAASIALRNAVFKGVPKAFWMDAYEKARGIIAGNADTFAKRRDAALEFLNNKYAVKLPRVLNVLKDDAGNPLRGINDITAEHLVTLRGIVTALKENEISVGEAFPDPSAVAPNPTKDIKGVAAAEAAIASKVGNASVTEVLTKK